MVQIDRRAKGFAGAIGAWLVLLCIGVAPARAQETVDPLPEPPTVPLSYLLEDQDGDAVPDHLGERVTVQGYANMEARRARAASSGPDWYFVTIQDAFGGVRLFGQGREFFDGTEVGSLVLATGTLTHRRGAEELILDAYQVTESHAPVEPLDVLARDVVGEGLMHRLVRLEGTPVDYDPYEETVILQDRSGSVAVRVTTRFLQRRGLSKRLHDDEPVTVVGIVAQADPDAPFDSDYRVAPRDPTDFSWSDGPPYLEFAVGLFLLSLLGWLVSYAYQRRGAVKRARELEKLTEELSSSKMALEASEAEFRGLFEDDTVARFVLDPERGVRRWNQAFEAFVGVGPEAIMGSAAPSLLDGFPELSAQDDAEDLPGQVEVRGHGSAGGPAVGLLALAPTPGSEEIHGSIHDITRRRELEEQLLWTQRMETVGRLAGGVAHDVNNMLGVILGNAELIQAEGPLPGTIDGDLAEIREAALRSSRLTKQLLTMARRDVAKPEILDLTAVTREMIPMLRRVVGSNIEMVTLLDEEIPPISIDLGQLEQVLLNLVVNACEAMPHGGKLVLETSALPSDGDGPGSTRLRVADTGVGMDEETQGRIFDPFFSTKDAGSGLGLSTVYGVVTRSGGAVQCSSGPGEGATFDLIFPAVRTAPEQRKGEDESGSGSALNLSVLLAEDEDGLRKLARRMLERWDCQVEEAQNGEEALRIFTANPDRFDVLVTDLVMPILGGWDLAEGARALRPDLPVVFVSGYANHADVRQRLQEESDVFLQKPFRAADLASALASLID